MNRINVTKTFLPPIEEYQAYLKQIWETGYLTNQGPLLKEFETKTKSYLGVDDFHFVSNGTIALQIALKALGIESGEIITTPFSYVATTSSILWERCTPVYVDIEPKTFCIDADKIEASITAKTVAIMAVHVFGNSCDVDKINEIASKHKLKVIYDGAHAFGVKYKGKSLLDYGDISTCSFHATKLFHTIEGGAVIAQDAKVSEKLGLIKKFGHFGDNHIMLGINAKSSEFQAAMGLCNLKYVTDVINKRKEIFEWYDELLSPDLVKPVINGRVEHNYSYYPVLFNSEEYLLECLNALEKESIFPRRYFYPSLNTLSYLKTRQDCPVSEDISSRILCLPVYPELEKNDVIRITSFMGRQDG